MGLSVYLNSSLVDHYFRQFNGHTQVNATDLRSLQYPDREMLERLGKKMSKTALSRQEIDDFIEGELALMTDEENPLLAQQKIDEALQIVRALGMPRGAAEREISTHLISPSRSQTKRRMGCSGKTAHGDYTHHGVLPRALRS